MIFFVPLAWPFLIAIGLLAWYFPWWTLGVYLALTWGLGIYFSFKERRVVWGGFGGVIPPVKHESVEDAMKYPHFQGDFREYRIIYREPIRNVLWKAFLTPFIIPVVLIAGAPIL